MVMALGVVARARLGGADTEGQSLGGGNDHQAMCVVNRDGILEIEPAAHVIDL